MKSKFIIFSLILFGCSLLIIEVSSEAGNENSGNERPIEQLIESLKDKNPEVRLDAARKLGEIKDKRVVAPLISALKDEHPYVRRRATEALGNFYDNSAVEPLILMLNDKDSFVQKYAVESLGKITGQSFGGDSIKWQEWWIKNKAKVLIKSSIEDGQGIATEDSELLKGVKVIRITMEESHYGKEYPFFKYSKKILGYGGLTVISGEDKRTSDATLHIRAEEWASSAYYYKRLYSGTEMPPPFPMTTALGYGSGTETEGKLLRYSGAQIKGELLMKIGETSPYIALYSLPFSGGVSPPMFIPQDSYQTPNDAPFGEAFHSAFLPVLFRMLERIKGSDTVVIAAIAALNDREDIVRWSAAGALGMIKDARAVEPLIAALNDREVYVRRSAAEALGWIKDSRAVEPLISALKDIHPDVQKSAEVALVKIGNPAVESLIAAALNNGEVYSIRGRAAIVLGLITGQDIGDDPIKWQEWWKKNRGTWKLHQGLVW